MMKVQPPLSSTILILLLIARNSLGNQLSQHHPVFFAYGTPNQARTAAYDEMSRNLNVAMMSAQAGVTSSMGQEYNTQQAVLANLIQDFMIPTTQSNLIHLYGGSACPGCLDYPSDKPAQSNSVFRSPATSSSDQRESHQWSGSEDTGNSNSYRAQFHGRGQDSENRFTNKRMTTNLDRFRNRKVRNNKDFKNVNIDSTKKENTTAKKLGESSICATKA